MEIKNANGLSIVNLVFLLLILISTIFYSNQILVHLAALVFTLFVYKCFAKDIKQYLYFISIFLALIGSGVMVPITKTIGINLWYISVFAYYVYFIIEIIKDKKFTLDLKIFKNKFAVFFIIFICYILISLFFASDLLFSLRALKLFMVMIPLTIMFIIQNLQQDILNKTFKFLLYAYTFVLLFGTFEVFGFKFGLDNSLIAQGKYKWDWNFHKRIPITFFYNQNNYAVLMVLGMLFLLIAASYQKNKARKRVLIVLSVISQVNLIFTSSRTAIITVFIVCFSLFVLGVILRLKDLFVNSIKYTLLICLTFIVVSLFKVTQPYYGKFDSLPGIKLLNASNYTVYEKYLVNNKIEILNNINQTEKDTQNSNSNKKKIEEIKNQIEENKYIEENKERLSEEGSASNDVRLNVIKNIVRGVIIDKHYFGFGVGNTGWYLKNQENTKGIINAHSMWFEFLGDFGIFMFLYLICIYLYTILELIGIYKSSSEIKSMSSIMAAVGVLGFVFLSFGPSSIVNYTPFWMLIGISGSILLNYRYKKID
ncbi:O-antigen ligase family protein [Clostridium swellfunianum]|uniref:O-antigen ligase family protein n=1 Tax=Clostridium swellfunianum TaxID=1367462 RepID=UPI00202F8EE3|nr:O-antigen ligase family protein [Clostridium swellfunianum]MCM0647441.1 O-antigen ligase family protein [Clostridium swellfunianum]